MIFIGWAVLAWFLSIFFCKYFILLFLGLNLSGKYTDTFCLNNGHEHLTCEEKRQPPTLYLRFAAAMKDWLT
jgi:hypothetical protein